MMGSKAGIYPAAKSITPTDFPNLKLWLDASTITTDGSVISGSDRVSLWKDKSPNGKDAIQNTGIAQPLYESASDSVFYDAGTAKSLVAGVSGDWDFLHGSNGCEVFITFDFTTASSTSSLIQTGTNPGWLIAYQHDGATVLNRVLHVMRDLGSVDLIVLGSANNVIVSGTNNNIEARHGLASSPNFTQDNNGSVSTANYINTPSNLNNSIALLIGSTAILSKMKEIIIFDRVLSASERAQINTYRSLKWP